MTKFKWDILDYFQTMWVQISLQLDDFFLNSNFLSRLANNFQQILRLGFAFLKGEILVCLLLAYGIGTTLFVGRQSKIFFAQSKDCAAVRRKKKKWRMHLQTNSRKFFFNWPQKCVFAWKIWEYCTCLKERRLCVMSEIGSAKIVINAVSTLSILPWVELKATSIKF